MFVKVCVNGDDRTFNSVRSVKTFQDKVVIKCNSGYWMRRTIEITGNISKVEIINKKGGK